MMETYTISRLGSEFSLSRSTLLYYDRIGLLKPSGRTSAGYRCYSGRDRERLARICQLRETGLSLKEIAAIVDGSRKPKARILEQRLVQVGEQMRSLQTQQQLLRSMLQHVTAGTTPPAVDKRMWVEMLRAAGMDDAAMEEWHRQFEERAPEAHAQFLRSLQIPEQEIESIRNWARERR